MATLVAGCLHSVVERGSLSCATTNFPTNSRRHAVDLNFTPKAAPSERPMAAHSPGELQTPEYTLRLTVPTPAESASAVARIIADVSVPCSAPQAMRLCFPVCLLACVRVSQDGTVTQPWEEAVEKLSENFLKEGRDLTKVAKREVTDAVCPRTPKPP